jgi:hypothetical protein
LILAIIYFPVIEKCINKFGITKKTFIIHIKSILKNPGEGWKCSLDLRQPTTLKQSLYNEAPGNTATCGPQYIQFMECHRFTVETGNFSLSPAPRGLLWSANRFTKRREARITTILQTAENNWTLNGLA